MPIWQNEPTNSFNRASFSLISSTSERESQRALKAVRQAHDMSLEFKSHSELACHANRPAMNELDAIEATDRQTNLPSPSPLPATTRLLWQIMIICSGLLIGKALKQRAGE